MPIDNFDRLYFETIARALEQHSVLGEVVAEHVETYSNLNFT